jgi:nucleoside-diphosphate-sugar epimerase
MSALDWAEVASDERFAPLRGTKVLVTGGAGFIGSHLVDALRALDCPVTILDNLSTGRPENLAHLLDSKILVALRDWRASRPGLAGGDHRILEIQPESGPTFRILLGDLRDGKACRAACEGVAYVFHQAALGSVPRSMEHPAETFDVNVAGTARLFQAARDAGVRRVVYASSSSVYGDSEKLPKREGEEGNPLSPYALSKVVDERLAETFGRCYRMEFIGLRYFNVFGPRQDPEGPYAAVIPRFLKAGQKGEPPIIYGDGEQTRDFTFVQDAVRVNLLAAVAPEGACGRAYNVAGGESTSINRLWEMIRKLFDRELDPVHVAPRPGDVRHSLADLEACRRALGYRPLFALAAALRTATAAFRRTFHV